MIVVTSFANATQHELLDDKACEEVKGAVGTFLGIADYFWKENERNNDIEQTEEDRKEKEKELLKFAGIFADQSANYSIVYDVWCKD